MARAPQERLIYLSYYVTYTHKFNSTKFKKIASKKGTNFNYLHEKVGVY